MTATPNDPLHSLSVLVQLERQARHAATVAELFFMVVNDTVRLVAYRQALLWRQAADDRLTIAAVSGLEEIDHRTPYIDFCRQLCTHLAKQPQADRLHPVDVAAIEAAGFSQLREWLPGVLLWWPLLAPRGELVGGLLLLRERNWDQAELSLLERLGDCYGHALAYLAGRPSLFVRLWQRPSPRHLVQAAVLAVLLFTLCLPARLSVLAPFEIVPRAPHIVSAPQDGVIHALAVVPGEMVQEGALLLRLDDTAARNGLSAARKTLRVMEEEQRRARQKAFLDEASRVRLLEIEARIEEQRQEEAYRQELLERSEVRAAAAGIAVFADVHDWLGKPVVVGEKIMVIADPARVEAEIRLAAADAIVLEKGAPIRLFFNVAPEKPAAAILRQASYEATVTPEGVLAFRLKATLAEGGDGAPRIGLRGTAKIYGSGASLFYYFLRRPLAALRQATGW